MEALTTRAYSTNNYYSNFDRSRPIVSIIPTKQEAYISPSAIIAMRYIDQATSEFPITILYLSRIIFRNTELVINGGLALQVKIYFEDGYYSATNDKFGVYGFGISLEEALADFKGSFLDYYEDIVQCPLEDLGESTIAVRNALTALATLVKNE